LAVMSFVQVQAAINRDPQLAEYRGHPALLARRPNYRVSLGFGMHLGWAIEGALGSHLKIDASYLSSHVNLAMKIEDVTRQYGVVLLFSEQLVLTCNQSFAHYFRVVDHVKLPGGTCPNRLFTVDLDIEAAKMEAKRPKSAKADRHKDRVRREELKMVKLEEYYKVSAIFRRDKHIQRMRKAYEPEFFNEWEKGYMNYEAGEWDVATEVFERTKRWVQTPSAAEDGPSCTLLQFMRQFDFKAPKWWRGFRELT